MKTRLICISSLLLCIVILKAQPLFIDGHSHMGLYLEEGEVVLRSQNLIEKGFSGIFYTLPVDRTETEDMVGRLELEMKQIRNLLQRDPSLDIHFALEYFEGMFSNPEQLVEEMAELDIRYITLIDNKKDGLFQGSLLTEKGRKVVKLLNKYGLTIDVAHLREDQILQVIKVSEEAVIASHSACWEVTRLERNLSDQVLNRIAENGGLVLISFNNVSLYKEGENKVEGIKLFTDHLMHAVKIAGIQHVGIGTDLQANGRYVQAELWTGSTLQDIRAELSNTGMSQQEVELLFSGNLIRFFKLD